MKRSVPLALLLLSLLVAVTALAGEKAAAADREALVRELQRTEAKFLESIKGLSEAQWNFKPAEDRWSIAECAEHIAATEPLIRSMTAAALSKELTPEMLAEARKDEAVLTGVTDRSKKFKAPEPVVPTNRFGSPSAAVESFTKERAETIKLATGEIELRRNGDKHFLFGPLDGYGWFLFESAHTERHTLQIEEVKADPNFPKM
ncbi:MAG TPA: DinB family protein [Thermoanaerobaculia bacterium]|nr:DinB family protein [Thermoanaerobaculia bacterium]